jgi:DNA-binding CsgD family transcriptional regulator
MLSVLSFMRGRRAGQFTDREIKVLESLMPHLRRAVRLHHVFAQNENLTALLDNQPVAAVFVGEQGSVHFANRSALAMLGRDDGIGIDRNGCLTSTDNVLRQMIAAACRTAAGNGLAAGGAVLVARASGKSPYTVSVSPFRNANPLSTVRYPGAVVFIVDAEIRREPIIQILQRLYGLTPAEASLAGLLVEGKDLTAACEELGIRRTTGRSHLQHLSAKLGVRRQAELVSTVLRTVGMLAVGVENR